MSANTSYIREILFTSLSVIQLLLVGLSVEQKCSTLFCFFNKRFSASKRITVLSRFATYCVIASIATPFSTNVFPIFIFSILNAPTSSNQWSLSSFDFWNYSLRGLSRTDWSPNVSKPLLKALWFSFDIGIGSFHVTIPCNNIGH